MDSAIAANKAAAHAEAEAVDQLATESVNAAIAVSAVSFLLAIWLSSPDPQPDYSPRSKPLRMPFKACRSSRDVRVPELRRADEIGAMAQAFEISVLTRWHSNKLMRRLGPPRSRAFTRAT